VVSEAILSRRLGVGRTPVREALQRLAREWLVVILPRRGIVVSDIDPVRQLRLLEARREIERFLARCAARRATPAQRALFQDIAAGMDQAAARPTTSPSCGWTGNSTCWCWTPPGNEFGRRVHEPDERPVPAVLVHALQGSR